MDTMEGEVLVGIEMGRYMLEGIGVAGGKKVQMAQEEAGTRGERDDFTCCLGRSCAGRAVVGIGVLFR